MAKYIKALLKAQKNMELAFYFLPEDFIKKSIMENGQTIYSMEKVQQFIIIEINIQETFTKILGTAMELMNGRMEKNMQGNSITENFTDMQFTIIKIMKDMKENT